MESIKVVTEVLDGLMPTALPAEGDRKCKIFADGKEIFPGSLTVEHDTWALKVGIRPEGWQGFLFRENGGGGSFTIPWALGPKRRDLGRDGSRESSEYGRSGVVHHGRVR